MITFVILYTNIIMIILQKIFAFIIKIFLKFAKTIQNYYTYYFAIYYKMWYY